MSVHDHTRMKADSGQVPVAESICQRFGIQHQRRLGLPVREPSIMVFAFLYRMKMSSRVSIMLELAITYTKV